MNESTDMYDVAVIIINYNTSNHTINCVNSVISNAASSIKYKIVVVDNGSEIKDYELLRSSIEKLSSDNPVTIFRSRINTGFSAGNMAGVQLVNAKYYFFLNNDCILQNDCLSILYDFGEQHPEAALLTPQLYNVDGNHQTCVNYFPSLITKILGTGILRLTYGKRFFDRRAIHNKPIQVDEIAGCQMFVRAEPFHRIGGFDTVLFLYGEEDDLAIRMHKDGNTAYLVPEAKNTHIGGASTPKSLDIRKEFYISFIYVYKKHYGYIRTLLLMLTLAFRFLRKSFTNSGNISLTIFILSGAHLKHSIRHKQKILPR